MSKPDNSVTFILAPFLLGISLTVLFSLIFEGLAVSGLWTPYLLLPLIGGGMGALTVLIYQQARRALTLNEALFVGALVGAISSAPIVAVSPLFLMAFLLPKDDPEGGIVLGILGLMLFPGSTIAYGLVGAMGGFVSRAVTQHQAHGLKGERTH